MNKDEIKSIIIKTILEVAPDIEEQEIEPNENLQQSLEIDSFDFLKILTQMNEEISIEVPESDYSKVGTLEDMAEYFMQQI